MRSNVLVSLLHICSQRRSQIIKSYVNAIWISKILLLTIGLMFRFYVPLRGLLLPGTLGTIQKSSAIALVEFEGTNAVKPAKINSDQVKHGAVSHPQFKACRTRRTGIYFCFVSGLASVKIGIQSKLDLYSSQFSSPEPLPSIVKPFSRTPLSWRSFSRPQADGYLFLRNACISLVFPCFSRIFPQCDMFYMIYGYGSFFFLPKAPPAQIQAVR